MPAGAPYGNRNAEKWTFKKSVKLFHDALELSNQKETTIIHGIDIEGYKYDFIGEIARNLGTFKEIFTHLTKREGFKSLKRLHNQLITALEQNCYHNTKKGIIREATGIVNLKSNHRWTDRLDNTSGDEKIETNQINISMPDGSTINLGKYKGDQNKIHHE